MKRAIIILSTIALAMNVHAAKGVDISGIEPPHWWAGMADKSLQLQVAGPSIRDAEVSIDYPGVTIDKMICQAEVITDMLPLTTTILTVVLAQTMTM